MDTSDQTTMNPTPTESSMEASTPGSVHSEEPPSLSSGNSAQKRSEDKTKELHCAASFGSAEVVEKCILRGYDVNIPDERGRTAYLLAAYFGKVSVLEVLEKYKANIKATDKYGRSAVHLASKENSVEALLHLLKVGADATAQDYYRRQPLHLASLKGAMDTLKILIDHLKSMKIEEPLHCVDGYGRTPLHLAAKENRPNIIQYLIENGANPEAPDNYGREPHHLAALHGCNKALERLLSFVDINSVDSWQHTAYYLAVYHKHKETEAFLLENGADPQAGSWDSSPSESESESD